MTYIEIDGVKWKTKKCPECIHATRRHRICIYCEKGEFFKSDEVVDELIRCTFCGYEISTHEAYRLGKEKQKRKDVLKFLEDLRHLRHVGLSQQAYDAYIELQEKWSKELNEQEKE